MKIADNKCKRGNNDMFIKDNGNQAGLYCKNCGKWIKWLNKNERNLARYNSIQETNDYLMEG